MNSKQRVLSAIKRQETDRVPMDFSANSTTMQRLMQEMSVNSHRELLKFLSVDIIDIRGVVEPVYRGPVAYEKNLGNGVIEDFRGWRTRIEDTASGPERMYCEFVLKEASGIEEFEKHIWPSADWFDFTQMYEGIEQWKDFAVMASGASIWQHPSFLRSLDRLLMDLVIDPELAGYLLDKYTDFYTDYFDRMFSACKGTIDILRIADDLGMQDRLLISPELFDKYLFNRLKKIVDMAKSYDVKVMFHSCGAIFPLIGRLIEAGIDILDPVQVRAKDMDPGKLKKDFGDKICFHGSIDTQYLLPHGSVEEVKNTVNEMVGILANGGGFILAPSHVLQNDVPAENIAALYQAGITAKPE